MPLTLASKIGQRDERFVTAVNGIASPQSIVWVSEGPARIGSIGLIVERLNYGLTEIAIKETIGAVTATTRLTLYGIDLIDAASARWAVQAAGITDTQARANVAAAPSAFEGLKALGLAQ